MVAPQAVIAIKFTTNALTLCCAVLRFFILRKYENGSRTTRSILCHIFLFTAWAMDFSATSAASYVIANEIKYINAGDSKAEVQAKLFLPHNLKVFFYAHLMYYLALCTIRIAYLVFYSDLYRRIITKRRYALYAAGFICASVYIVALLILFLWCRPFVDNWNPQSDNPHCPSIFDPPAFASLAVMNIAADVAILIVPVLVISAFRLKRAEKASLVLVFAIGGTSIVASVARLGVIYQLLADKAFTWNTLHVFSLWSHAEVFFGVMAFTLPSFRYVLKGFIRKIETSTNRRGSVRLTETTNTKHLDTRGTTIHNVVRVGTKSWGAPEETLLETMENKGNIKVAYELTVESEAELPQVNTVPV